MAYHQPFQITGFHSCDKGLGLRLLNGTDELRPSGNPWDWLGPGVYFWEQNPYRALLGNCLNLIEPNAIKIVKAIYAELRETMKQSGEEMPVNNGANRRLDCAVIKYMHGLNEKWNVFPFDSIRSPFPEGGPIYAGANFTDRLHIEICMLNASLIKGYFLPRPVPEYNPYLDKAFKGNQE